MGRCMPLSESDWTKLEGCLRKIQSPPVNMRKVVITEHSETTAYLIDSSVCSFQGDGFYSFRFQGGAEEVRRVCMTDEEYRLCESPVSPFSDRIVNTLDGYITGRVVSRLTTFS